MRKIVVSEFMSADGVIESPDLWQLPFQSEEMGEITVRQNNDNEAYLFGRATYEMFAGYWPTLKNNEFGVADKINNAPKYVVSTTLQTADWHNTTILKSLDELRHLKQQSGGRIGIIGSAKLVHALFAADLIDEIQVLLHPIVLGKGVRLFPDGYQASMTLTETKTLPNGVLYLTYQIEHKA